MSTRSGALSVCTLALGAMLGFAPAASAAGVTPPQITCPDNAAGVFAEGEYAKANGKIVRTYLADDGTTMDVIKIDGHFEIFGSNGYNIGRACYQSDPGQPSHVSPSEQGNIVTGSRGGGGDRAPAKGGYGVGPGGVGIGIIVTWRDVPWSVRVA